MFLEKNAILKIRVATFSNCFMAFNFVSWFNLIFKNQVTPKKIPQVFKSSTSTPATPLVSPVCLF